MFRVSGIFYTKFIVKIVSRHIETAVRHRQERVKIFSNIFKPVKNLSRDNKISLRMSKIGLNLNSHFRQRRIGREVPRQLLDCREIVRQC